jgi:hypothetical protein
MGVGDETQPCTGRENREPTTDRSHRRHHPWFPNSIVCSASTPIFLDRNGLSIVEPADDEPGVSAANASGMGVVVNVANWTNANPPKLQAHEPQPTESLVALEIDGG